MHRFAYLADSPLFQRMYRGYRKLFSVEEIERNRTLQWLFGAMLLFFYLTFSEWIGSPTLDKAPGGGAECWPYFLDCQALRFLELPPYGYSHMTFYMALFAAMIAIVYAMWKKQWTLAHVLMTLLFVWEAFAALVLSGSVSGVYNYYHLILTGVLLFIPHKEFFAKAAFVLLYFISATIKFYPTWILGTYFSTLELGLPIFGHFMTMPLAESVILSQVVGCWFLLSRNPWLQRTALVYFSIFHLYSGTLVQYNYPTIAELPLLILFGFFYRHQWPPLKKTAIAGYVLLIGLIGLQMIPNIIPGDEKMTMEGYRYGMWMFDANHQCAATFKQYFNEDKEGLTEFEWRAATGCARGACTTMRKMSREGEQWVFEQRMESPRGEVRCSPYSYWQTHLSWCRSDVERVSMQFDHSINGGPFFRIVDEPDICGLTYKPFWRNDWIKEPPEAPAVGQAVQNLYY